MPEANPLFARNQVNAVYGAGIKTEIAARAFICDHGVHDLGSAENGVDGTSLNTFCTADAFILSDPGHHGLFFDAVLGVKGLRLDIEQIG